MKYSNIFSAALIVASGLAKDVACRVGGTQQSVVDLDTGVCPFVIPGSLPVNSKFTDMKNYLIDAYYVKVDNTKYFNDIAKGSRTIDIPAKLLFDQGDLPLSHIHDEAASNSTLGKRFNMHLLNKRDVPEDFIRYIKSLGGIEVKGSFEFTVTLPDPPSTGGSGSGSGSGAEGPGIVTVTDTLSTTVTVTSCSNHKCTKKAVGATWGPVTTTVEGVVTVYTTWCPETEVPATWVPVTITLEGGKVITTSTPATWVPITTTLEGGKIITTSTPAIWIPVTTTLNGGEVITTSTLEIVTAETVPETTTKAAPGGPSGTEEGKAASTIKAGEVTETPKETKPAVELYPETSKESKTAGGEVIETTKAVPETTKAVPETTKAVPETTKAVPETTKAVPETTKTTETSKAVPEITKTTETPGEVVPSEEVPSTLSTVIVEKSTTPTGEFIPTITQSVEVSSANVPSTLSTVTLEESSTPAASSTVPSVSTQPIEASAASTMISSFLTIALVCLSIVFF